MASKNVPVGFVVVNSFTGEVLSEPFPNKGLARKQALDFEAQGIPIGVVPTDNKGLVERLSA